MDLLLLCILLGSATSAAARSVALFPYEEAVLESSTLRNLPQDIAHLLAIHTGGSEIANSSISYECKVFPGDADWPSPYKWNHLRQATGSLIAGVPAASVCYNNGTSLLNQTACDTLTAGWTDVFTQ